MNPDFSEALQSLNGMAAAAFAPALHRHRRAGVCGLPPSGAVEEIETRATLIRTYDGRRVVIPNSNLLTQSVSVNTAFQARRRKRWW